MYIAIYSFAIVLFVGLVLFLFLRKQKNSKARIAKMQMELVKPNILDNGSILNLQEKEEQVEKEVVEEVKVDPLEDEKKLSVEQEAIFEDFSLDGGKKNANKPNFATVGRKKIDSLFEFEDEFDSDFPMADEADEIDEEEIARYEKSLRESLKFDIDEEFDKFSKNQENGFFSNNNFTQKNDFESFSNFDINQFRGKSQSEIAEMIKNFPPKAQEIILTDILARKNWDD